jgi:glycosyltransferase involved in cell wall biosynthesis
MIANYLGQSGYQVEYIADNSRPTIQRISEEEARSRVHNFTYYRSPFRRYTSAIAAALYRPLPSIESLKESDANLVLLDRIPPPQFLLALGKVPSPTVLMFHGLTVETVLPPNPLAAAYELYLRVAMRSLALASDSSNVFFKVLTNGMKGVLERCGIHGSQVFVIPSGIDFSKIPEPIESDRFTVTFVGRIEGSLKGIDFLVRVLRRLESSAPLNLEVNIIGSGRDTSLLDEFSESHIIRYHGYIPDREKAEMISRSDLFLVTSYIEPFSLTTVEALAGGAFVLTTPCSGPSSIVGKSPQFGAILPYRPHEFVKEVMRAYDRWNSSKSELMAERRARRRQALSLYSTERMVKENLGMVRKITLKS